MFGPDHDDSLFGDLNRDGQENWQDDLLGMWLVGETLRLQRERRELEEKLERERRAHRRERLWQDLTAHHRRNRDQDDDDDDDDDDAGPVYLSRPATAVNVNRPAAPPAMPVPAQPPDPPPAEPPRDSPAWAAWLVIGGALVLVIFLILAAIP